MTNEQEQRLHEQLCAYVLGEATNEERAEIERELLRSPELRAQRDTIERTVGLVKHALGKDESLSPEAAETLYSAVSSSRPSAWRSSGFLRLAAGIGAVALGYAIVRESSVRPEAEVAKVEENARFAPRGLVHERRDDEAPAVVDRVTQGNLPPGRGDISEVAKMSEGRPVAAKVGAQQIPADAPAGSVPPEGMKGSQPGAALQPSVDPAELHKLAKADELVRRQRDFDAGLTSSFSDPKEMKQEVQLVELDAHYGRGGDKNLDAKVAQTEAEKRMGVLGYSGSISSVPVGAGGGAVPSSPSGPATGGAVSPSPTSSSVAWKPGETTALGRNKSKLDTGGAAAGGPSASTPAPMDRKAGLKDSASAGDNFWLGEKVDADSGEAGKREFRGQLQVRLGEEVLVLRDDEQSIPYYQLPPAEQQIYLERQCRRILDECVRRPNERPRDMFFRFWGDNPFEVTALDPLSTFGADVDTASYALARRYLKEGNVPEKAQIRTEEFVNYFKSDVAAPSTGVFAIHTDLAPSRYSSDTNRQMLRVVVRGKDLSKVERPRMNLTFVVDVSGSMREQMRLEMVKTAIRLLVTQLDPYDKIGIVKFSTDASVVLPLTYVSEREKIELAISPLTPDGSTNSNAGLELGYGMAVGGLDKEATNRVVFLSDGVANVGETDPAKIAERVKPMREKGIYLNTIGVGMNNHNDVLLEQLADKADGMCTYIDTADEAKKQLVDNFSGAFQPIARDVKIQVEFDATQVLRYRLLGYENRAIADADFRNDKVDAGELGAGHQVTALYEIERQGVSNLEKPLATVRLRWKEPRNFGLNPESDAATEISKVVAAGPVSTFEGAGQSYRKAVMAAQFAEILRRSVHARGDSLDTLLTDAVKLQAEIPGDKDFTEFVTLVSQSKDLILRTMPHCDELCQAIDEVRESQFRRAQIESMQKELDQKTLEELKRQNDVLEAKLRELVRRRLENRVR